MRKLVMQNKINKKLNLDNKSKIKKQITTRN